MNTAKIGLAVIALIEAASISVNTRVHTGI